MPNDLTAAPPPRIPFAEQLQMAKAFADSGLFGVKSPNQALALMALCEAEGLHPGRAVQIFHVVDGRAAMRADAMLARFQESGGRVRWLKYSSECVEGEFSHPAGGSVVIAWSLADANRAGLMGKNNWKHYPRAMLRSRCISEGCRTVFPGAAAGQYSVEEVQDMSPQQLAATNAAAAANATDPPTELWLRAKAAAKQGVEFYQQFWEGITRAERKALAGKHTELRAEAAAPKPGEVIDAETGEAAPPAQAAAAPSAPLSKEHQSFVDDMEQKP